MNISDLLKCPVHDCTEVVEAGEDCGRHGFTCPSCRQPTSPYRYQKDCNKGSWWACSECDTEIPGFREEKEYYE